MMKKHFCHTGCWLCYREQSWSKNYKVVVVVVVVVIAVVVVVVVVVERELNPRRFPPNQ